MCDCNCLICIHEFYLYILISAFYFRIEGANGMLLKVNLHMRQHFGVRYVSLGGLRYPRDYRRGDKVHLSAAGYRVVWGAIRRKLCYLFA